MAVGKLSATAHLAYSRMQRRFFDMIMVAQHWTPEEMQSYQRQQLSSLLRHAKANVPFYRERLKQVFRGDDVDWQRWSDLPIVTRGDLVKCRSAMQAANLSPSYGGTAEFSTSGSTGEPVTTTHNGTEQMAAVATLLRMYVWHELDWTRNVLRLDGENPTVGAYPEGEPGRSWGPAWDPRATGQQYNVNRLATSEELVEFMERKKIAYFRGGATDVRMLAYEAMRLGANVRLKAAIVRSAVVTEYGEELVRKAFGAATIPFYSSKEGHGMAHRCPLCRNYHIAAETVFMEILRADGTPCEPGETGRVIITPLLGYAQPLIRYDQGDLAMVGEPCSCGRNLPVLVDIVGRVKHVFRRPDGRTLVPLIPAKCLVALDVQNYQIAQVALDAVEVRYVPRDPAVPGNELPLSDAIRTEMGDEVAIRFKRLTAFDTPPGRKHLEYISELSLPR